MSSVINGRMTLTINNTKLADEGQYECVEGRAILLAVRLKVNGVYQKYNFVLEWCHCQ